MTIVAGPRFVLKTTSSAGARRNRR
jgi:hypothetical protein